ncbi:HAAS signaling domain-containing protein [Blastococcus sp. SYSU DS0617]
MTAPQQAEPDVEVRAYARQVRAALADVPAERLAELLEDLEEHLVEVAAEGGEPLALRLGPPAEYAAELRRAAGLAEPSEPVEHAAPAGPSWNAGLSAHLDRLTATRQYAAVRDFLPELRPAWWVLRAWAPLVAVDAVLFGSTSFPVPSLGLSPLVGLVLTGAAIAWSVRRGLRVRENPELADPRLGVVVNGGLALLALVALIAVADQPEPAMAYSYPEQGPMTLSHDDGTPITNIHPYSATGEPLSGVLLYDQDGRPIDNLSTYTAEGGEVQRLDEDPPAPANAFPQEQRVLTYDERGNRVWVRPSTGPGASPSPSAPAGDPAPEVEPLPGSDVEPLPGPAVEPLPGPDVEPLPGPAVEPAP